MDGELSPDVARTCLAALQKQEVQALLDSTQVDAVTKLCSWLTRVSLSPPSPTAPTSTKADLPESTFTNSPRKAVKALVTDSPSRCSETSTSIQRAAPAANCAESPCTSSADDNELAAELAKVHSWDSFDVFRVKDLSRDRVLEVVTLAVLKRLGLISHFQIDLFKLTSFLQSIEAAYNSNPYHNSTHAADVVQSLGVLLAADALQQRLSHLELLALVFSAAIHDVGHPGVTNEFLVRTKSRQALLYNDNSPNENMHASRAFQLLDAPGHNFLDTLHPQQYAVFRRLVIDVVLATDMAGHALLLASFQSSLASLGPDLSRWPPALRKHALQMLMHCADIANPAKPLHTSLRWTSRIMEESWRQGDKEKELGIPVSPLCDKGAVHVPSMQQHFLEHYVQPSFQAVAQLAPALSSMALQHVAKNIEYWQRLSGEGAKDPQVLLDEETARAQGGQH